MSAAEDMAFSVVQNDAVDPKTAEFERCLPWLKGALTDTHFDISDVARALGDNRAQLWPGKSACIVTEIDTLAQTRVVRVWLAGGDMDEILTMAKGIEAWARLNGCTEVLVEGREGWKRALKDQDYDLFSVVLRKKL